MIANETQVGGTHYRTPFQHWDLAHELDLGYFEGQVSKYLTRHRFKKGKEDAEKALHFAKKLHELALSSARQPRHKFTTIARMTEYAESNKLLPLEYLHDVGVQLVHTPRPRDAAGAHPTVDPRVLPC
jgi:hypothetical protein